MDLDLQLKDSAEALEKASRGSRARFCRKAWMAGALNSTEDAKQSWSGREQLMLRRSRLEAELRTLEAQQRQHQTRIKAFIKEEEREKALTEAWVERGSQANRSLHYKTVSYI